MKFAYLKKGEKKMTPYEQLCNHVREGKANIDVGMFRGIRVWYGKKILLQSGLVFLYGAKTKCFSALFQSLSLSLPNPPNTFCKCLDFYDDKQKVGLFF